MSRFWSKLVHQLQPYVPGEQPKIDNLIKLNTNENPYPPSPKALQAIAEGASGKLRLYPDPENTRLRQTIASYYKLDATQVFVGNGSDEVLAHTFCALLKHDAPLLFPDISYSFYPVYCKLYGIDYTTIPLRDDFTIHTADYNLPNGGIIFPNPNAPTGIGLPLHGIQQLLDDNPNRVVVVDEAYIDFGGTSAASLIPQYPNLLVVQTLSKSRSLAGIRVGFALGHADLIQALVRVKDSFNSYPLGSLDAAAAAAAIADKAYFEQTCQRIINTREQLITSLSQLGFKTLPSQANFVFTTHPNINAKAIAHALREKGIIVRHFDAPRIHNHLRITVGSDDECHALIQALTDIVHVK